MSATNDQGLIPLPALLPPDDAFYFFVEGLPEPSGSPKIIKMGGRPAIRWQTGPKWTSKIRAALDAELPTEPRPLMSGPIYSALRFWMPSPKKSKFPVPATPPDLDKLVRAAWDGFVNRIVDDTSGSKQKKQVPMLIEDDARFIGLLAYEHYSLKQTGVEIWVWPASLLP